jgi:hypothetical protein
MFTEFVQSTRCLTAEDRAEALRAWLNEQVLGQRVVVFDGSEESLKVITVYVEGKGYVSA